MILAPSPVADKADLLTQLTEDLAAFVRRSAHDGVSLDDVERGVFRRLLDLGHHAIDLFLSGQGDGDLGSHVEVENGRVLQRSDATVRRPLRTIFGEHVFEAYVYSVGGTANKRPIELRPVDARINLPRGKASYLLQEFSQLFCVEKAFAVGSRQYAAVFGQELSVDVLEDINRVMGEQADRYLEALPPPPTAEEGAILVVSADGKGVPLVREDAEKVPAFEKKERPGNRRMATLGCVYSVDPFVRTPEQIVAALFRDDATSQRAEHAEGIERPEACHKHYRAYFSAPASASEEAIPSAIRTWTWLAEEAAARCGSRRKIVRLMDGQPSLWDASDICLEDFVAQRNNGKRKTEEEFVLVDVLDVLHVSGYVWKAAKVFYSHKEHQEAFVQDRLLRILRGEASGVIMGMRRMATERGLKGPELKEVRTACNYFENNLARMRYDEYLEAGYPIASGVIEGACRHVIKDRMEHGGMRWTLAGAQAMLNVRCVCASSAWDAFHRWRQAEQAENAHPFRAAVENRQEFNA